MWIVGAAAGAMQSTLDFSDAGELDIRQYAITATLGYVRPSRLSFRASLGTVLDGSLEGQGRTHDIGTGVIGAISVAKQWPLGAWFVTGSLGFSASRVTTTETQPGATSEGLIATDLRAGAIAGRTFGTISPYILARGFAGPVLWHSDAMDVQGTDVHHYQLGAGVSVATANGLSFVLDISALGERSASLGVSFRL